MKVLALLITVPLTLLAYQPNVLFILVDDLGAMDLTNEGSTFYETPNIDRIANEGMKFSRDMPPVRYAVHPVPAYSPVNILPTMASLNISVDLPERHTEKKDDSTAIYHQSMKEIYGLRKLP